MESKKDQKIETCENRWLNIPYEKACSNNGASVFPAHTHRIDWFQATLTVP